MKAEDRFYQITLEHCGCPAYWSFSKQYAGTMEMLKAFIDELGQDAKPGSYKQGITDAFRRYQEGYHDATAFIAHSELQLIHPLTAYAVTSVHEAPFFYEHTNVWGFPYFITGKQMDAEFVYLRRGNELRRFVKATIESPMYGTEEDDCTSPLDGGFWGHPCVLKFHDGWLGNQIMFCDQIFGSKEEMQQDISTPAAIDFTGFFEDVFGDG